MGRHRGYWWAPDGTALLAARVDERPVRRWYIADPAHPDRPAAGVRYPVAGTPNADVSLVLARAGGAPSAGGVGPGRVPLPGHRVLGRRGPETPLIVVQTRDQREMRVLAVDAATGATTVVRADTDPHWLEIVPGVPARTAGRPDRLDRRRGRGAAAARGHGRRPGGGRRRAGHPGRRCRSGRCSAWTARPCCSPRRRPSPPRSGSGPTAGAGLEQVSDGPGCPPAGGRAARP